MAQRERAQRRAPARTHRKGRPQRKDQHRPTPSRHRATPEGASPPRHAAEPRTRRHTNCTVSRPPTTGPRTGEGGHTHTGRRGYTHRASRREHRRATRHHALSARRRPQPQQGPPDRQQHRHQQRMRTRPQHTGLRGKDPQRTQDQGTCPQGGQPRGHPPDPSTRAAQPQHGSNEPHHT